MLDDICDFLKYFSILLGLSVIVLFVFGCISAILDHKFIDKSERVSCFPVSRKPFIYHCDLKEKECYIYADGGISCNVKGLK